VEPSFHILGASHLAALVATLALAVASAWLGRRWRGRRWRGQDTGRVLERALAAALLVAVAIYIPLELASGAATVWSFLPFHLCDMAIFVAAFALVTRHPLATETLVSWAFSGTLLAIVTPDLATDIPSRDYFFYFALHAGVIIAAATLTFGAGLRPRRGAALRAWLLTNAYAAAVALVNAAFGTNYMYLCARPEQASLLDWFGPWPMYIVVADLLALGMFAAIHVAVRAKR
jgi:hypothetical integral membrane protein (TIGR02206 family)